MERERNRWPDLTYEAWRETAATLQLWTQVVGKVRLALAPWVGSWVVRASIVQEGNVCRHWSPTPKSRRSASVKAIALSELQERIE